MYAAPPARPALLGHTSTFSWLYWFWSQLHHLLMARAITYLQKFFRWPWAGDSVKQLTIIYGLTSILPTCQPKIFLCRTKSHILQDFSVLFLQDTPGSFTYHWPYTSNLCLHTILYQNASHKFCRTFSRICRTAGYLRQNNQDSPAKSCEQLDSRLATII